MKVRYGKPPHRDDRISFSESLPVKYSSRSGNWSCSSKPPSSFSPEDHEKASNPRLRLVIAALHRTYVDIWRLNQFSYFRIILPSPHNLLAFSLRVHIGRVWAAPWKIQGWFMGESRKDKSSGKKSNQGKAGFEYRVCEDLLEHKQQVHVATSLFPFLKLS